jgi:hypothetical protein
MDTLAKPTHNRPAPRTVRGAGQAVPSGKIRGKTARKQRQQPMSFPTATGGIARLAHQHAQKSGIDIHPLLQTAGLSVQQVTDDRVRLPVKDQIEFLNLVADASGSEFLGIRLAQAVDLREIGLTYYVLASSPTLELCAASGGRSAN